VITREQLPGAPALQLVAAVGGDSRYYYYDKKKLVENTLFILVKELLENLA